MSDEKNAPTNEVRNNWFYYPIQFLNKIIISEQFQKQEELPNFNDEDHNAFLFTHIEEKESRSLNKEIQSLINEAVINDEFILLSSFLINNAEMMHLLIDAAKKMPGKVYILIGLDQSIFGSFNQKGEFEEIGLSDIAYAGGLVRKTRGAHLKFLVAGKNAIIMTTNLTSEGLYRNPEFGITFRGNLEVARALKRIFSLLWHTKSETLLYQTKWLPAAKWNVVKTLNTTNLRVVPELILSSDKLISEINDKVQVLNSKTLLQIITEELKRARESIQIAVYAFELKADSEIVKILSDKVKNNVSVSILVPEMRTIISRSMTKILNDLKKLGVQVRYYRELHGKLLLIDQTSVIVFTGNFDAYLEKPNSFDIGFLTESTPLIQNCTTFFNHLWKEAAIKCGIGARLHLNVDLVVKSAEYLSNYQHLSVTKIKDIVSHCEKIIFYFTEKSSILEINGLDNRKLNLILDHKTVDFDNERVDISAILSKITPVDKKNVITFQIESLNLRLFWEEIPL